jgi:hypothetical protein
VNIVNEVATLQQLSVGQPRQRFADLFGETTKASNRTWPSASGLPLRPLSSVVAMPSSASPGISPSRPT